MQRFMKFQHECCAAASSDSDISKTKACETSFLFDAFYIEESLLCVYIFLDYRVRVWVSMFGIIQQGICNISVSSFVIKNRTVKSKI